MVRDSPGDLEARREDLRKISTQVREIGKRLSRELKQNRFYKGESERQERVGLLGSTKALSLESSRGSSDLMLLESGGLGASHKENITPEREGVVRLLKFTSAETRNGFESPSRPTPSGLSGLALRVPATENQEEEVWKEDDNEVGKRQLVVRDHFEHSSEASTRLLSERLESEIEAHMETHLALETVRDQLVDWEERCNTSDKRVESLHSEMRALKTERHQRETEFVANIKKHQTFLSEERSLRFRVEKDLHKVLKLNKGLEKTLRDLTRVAQEKERQIESLLTKDRARAEDLESKKSQEAEPQSDDRTKSDPGASAGLEEEVGDLKQRLEEALEEARAHKEAAETKEAHCVFLQQVNEDIMAELEGKEEDMIKKQGEIDDLEQEVMQKEGTINLLRESLEVYKNKR